MAANRAGSCDDKGWRARAAASRTKVEVTRGWGPERPCSDIEQWFDLQPRAPASRTGGHKRHRRRRGHAVDDFLLQHEVHVKDMVALLDQPEQQGCGDVVGQIPHQPQRRASTQRAEVEIQRIGFVNVQFAVAGRQRGELAQMTDRVAIDLDCVQRRSRPSSGRVIAPSPGPISTM